MNPTEKDIERFRARISSEGPIPAHQPHLGPCHIWTGRTNEFGYGIIDIGKKSVRAHRFAFFIADGRWPDPCALHRCDNPRCVRRSHLFEGTKQQNTDDMIAKGRARHRTPSGDEHWSHKHPELIRMGNRVPPELRPRGDGHYARQRPDLVVRGERQGQAKLSEDAVRYIRASGENLATLAARFGVSEQLISQVRHRKIWRHVS